MASWNVASGVRQALPYVPAGGKRPRLGEAHRRRRRRRRLLGVVRTRLSPRLPRLPAPCPAIPAAAVAQSPTGADEPGLRLDPTVQHWMCRLALLHRNEAAQVEIESKT